MHIIMNKKNLRYFLAFLLVSFALSFVLQNVSFKKDRVLIPKDYNNTTWLEIKGYKTPGYDITMSVGYGGEGKECKFFSVGLGTDVSKSTHMMIDANISKDDLHYNIRYPLNFKQGKCEFWAGRIEIHMEEYNDLDIKKYPKNKSIRATKIFDEKVLVLDLSYQEEDYNDNYNLYPLNLYCQRTIFYSDLYDDGTSEVKPLYFSICHNSTSVRQMNGIIGAMYNVSFLKEHNPLKVNLLLSKDLKCSRTCSEEEMQKAKALGVRKKMVEIYDERPPTSNPLNTRFIPSEVLFSRFKKQYNIKEK